jgi:orotate phosphoribosyltransferase
MAESRAKPESPPQGRLVTPERYLELIEQLLARAASLPQAPDSVVGMKRSGLFPAVYLSEQLRLPMFANTELSGFPFPRLSRPLLVDTTAWTGGSLRRTIARLERCGVSQVQVLVMFARLDPPPSVPGLNYLEQAERIPRLWYDPD